MKNLRQRDEANVFFSVKAILLDNKAFVYFNTSPCAVNVNKKFKIYHNSCVKKIL